MSSIGGLQETPDTDFYVSWARKRRWPEGRPIIELSGLGGMLFKIEWVEWVELVEWVEWYASQA